MTIRAATDAAGFVDRDSFAPFERHVMPNLTEAYYRDSDHFYAKEVEMRGGKWCGKGRLAGVSTVAKIFDTGSGDGLFHWVARLDRKGISILAADGLSQDDADDMRTALAWLESDESISTALTEAELTWRHVRDQAASRGTNVHRDALNAMAEGRPVPKFDDLTPEEQGYARGVVAFFHEHDPSPVLSEQVVADLDLGVAGRFDLVYESRSGVRTLLDLKTVEVVPRNKKRPFYPPTHMCQLAGYAYLLKRSGFEPCTAQTVLYVDASGEYQMVPSAATSADFLAAVNVYRRTAEIKRDTTAALKEAA